MTVKQVFTYDFPNCNSEEEIREYVLNDVFEYDDEQKKDVKNFSLPHLFWFLDLGDDKEEWFIETKE